MDETTAARLAAVLAAAYPGRRVEMPHLASWSAELSRLEPRVATEVVERLRGRAKEPPSVAEIRECVREVTKQTGSPRGEALPAGDEISFAEFLEQHPEMRVQLDKIGRE